MADTYEPTWRKCDECDVVYFIGAVHSPRNHAFAPIPLSLVPDNDTPGNFQVDWRQDFKELHDADGNTLGVHPVVVYGVGNYRPHNPSHFLEDSHVLDGEDLVWHPRQRMSNFRMAMDES